MRATAAPRPHLAQRDFEGIPVLTDDALADALGVRIAFSGRAGGVGAPPYDGLNLGSHVGDRIEDVRANRAALLGALGAGEASLVVPNQVHGTDLVTIASADARSVDEAAAAAAEGADGIVVSAPGVAALLCFADCVPVIVVSPTGTFAVAHAGWRGAVAGIAGKALAEIARLDAAAAGEGEAFAARIARESNAYIGPCIRRECFEVGPDVRDRFVLAFGGACAFGERNVDLPAAVAVDLVRAGADPNRICDAGACTVCAPDVYFSYRASGGTCGRHGAIAFRRKDVGA